MPAFLKDELDWRTSEKLALHIKSCKDCMGELTIEYLLYEGMDKIEESNEFDVQGELENLLEKTVTGAKRRRLIWACLLFAALLVICIIFFGGI